VAQRGPSAHANLPEAVQFYFRLLALLPLENWPQLALLSSTSSEEKADPAETSALVAPLLTEESPPGAWAPEALELARRSPHAAIAALIALRPPLRYRAQHIAAAILASTHLHQPAASLVSRAAGAAAAGHPVSDFERRAGEAHRKAHQAALELPAHVVPATRHDESPIAQPFALMVGNAGLVLLHPFLPRLFEACGLYPSPQVLKTEKAAALLHWLATGRDEVHEFELGCVKPMLGLRPETPLAVGEGLVGERSRAEGEALLASVIGHWKALGKTSPDALRVAFLQRRGALREDESGWRLQPEPESYDVLLGRLPWGLATVKLPWMTRPLYTDWPTP
jgi:contractile injection system tape measure protein